MNNINYLYLFFSVAAFIYLLFLFFNYKPNHSDVHNKKLLKNLLENFDLEIPDELKRLDSSSTDPQKL
tara:strand:- start:494 stop:697 length:204 start_codon:yes stop_codon:yes gene_type:complete